MRLRLASAGLFLLIAVAIYVPPVPSSRLDKLSSFRVPILHFFVYTSPAALLQFFLFSTMAISDKSPVSALTPAEREMVVSALGAHAKSLERAAKVAPVASIEADFTKLSAQARNLAARFQSGSLEV